jgi:hypothetical protein
MHEMAPYQWDETLAGGVRPLLVQLVRVMRDWRPGA